MIDDDITAAAKALLAVCKRKNFIVATAESCTAGLVAAALTDIAGASSIFDRGYVTYSNAAKHDMLGVPRDIFEQHGAVSKETAEAMVRGVFGRAPVDLAVSLTGIAGPDGGTADKPVGLVHFAAAARSGKLVHHEQRFGNIGRNEVRKRSVLQAIGMLHGLAEAEMANPPRMAG